MKFHKYNWIYDTSENLKSKNPIPKKSCYVKETDTGFYKIGDGVSNYKDLEYCNRPRCSYDIAKERGFTGSEDQWDTKIKSMYNDLKAKGYNGSEEDLRNHLNPNSAYGEAVRLGFTGTPDEYYHATMNGLSEQSWGNF